MQVTGLQGGGPPHVEGRRPHLMTRNIQGPLVRDQLRLRDVKGTFQLGVHADLILLDQIDAPNAGSASTVLHLSGRLPPCPVVGGHRSSADGKDSWAEACEGVFATVQ